MGFIEYKGAQVPIRGGEWLDIMNSWLYTVVEDAVVIGPHAFKICRERDVDGGKLFALPTYI